jgi:hypothetical protein
MKFYVPQVKHVLAPDTDWVSIAEGQDTCTAANRIEDTAIAFLNEPHVKLWMGRTLLVIVT